MKRKDIRLERLRLLCDQEGGYVNVARIAKVSADNLWQILHEVPLPSGNPRGVGNTLADKLERAFEKPSGWMDLPVSAEEQKEEPLVLDDALRRLGKKERDAALNVIEMAIENSNAPFVQAVRAKFLKHIQQLRESPADEAPPANKGTH